MPSTTFAVPPDFGFLREVRDQVWKHLSLDNLHTLHDLVLQLEPSSHSWLSAKRIEALVRDQYLELALPEESVESKYQFFRLGTRGFILLDTLDEHARVKQPAEKHQLLKALEYMVTQRPKTVTSTSLSAHLPSSFNIPRVIKSLEQLGYARNRYSGNRTYSWLEYDTAPIRQAIKKEKEGEQKRLSAAKDAWQPKLLGLSMLLAVSDAEEHKKPMTSAGLEGRRWLIPPELVDIVADTLRLLIRNKYLVEESRDGGGTAYLWITTKGRHSLTDFERQEAVENQSVARVIRQTRMVRAQAQAEEKKRKDDKAAAEQKRKDDEAKRIEDENVALGPFVNPDLRYPQKDNKFVSGALGGKVRHVVNRLERFYDDMRQSDSSDRKVGLELDNGYTIWFVFPDELVARSQDHRAYVRVEPYYRPLLIGVSGKKIKLKPFPVEKWGRLIGLTVTHVPPHGFRSKAWEEWMTVNEGGKCVQLEQQNPNIEDGIQKKTFFAFREALTGEPFPFLRLPMLGSVIVDGSVAWSLRRASVGLTYGLLPELIRIVAEYAFDPTEYPRASAQASIDAVRRVKQSQLDRSRENKEARENAERAATGTTMREWRQKMKKRLKQVSDMGVSAEETYAAVTNEDLFPEYRPSGRSTSSAASASASALAANQKESEEDEDFEPEINQMDTEMKDASLSSASASASTLTSSSSASASAPAPRSREKRGRSRSRSRSKERQPSKRSKVDDSMSIDSKSIASSASVSISESPSSSASASAFSIPPSLGRSSSAVRQSFSSSSSASAAPAGFSADVVGRAVRVESVPPRVNLRRGNDLDDVLMGMADTYHR